MPQTEAQGRVHTSAATVAVLPEPENIEVQINWANDVLEHTGPAGGPGGQNVNEVSPAIKLEHIPTGITVSMRDEKSQHKNRDQGTPNPRDAGLRVPPQRPGGRRGRRTKGDDRLGQPQRPRIRTYNFPQNRCTDHRLKGQDSEGANYNLGQIMAGDMDGLLNALVAYDKAQRLANL